MTKALGCSDQVVRMATLHMALAILKVMSVPFPIHPVSLQALQPTPTTKPGSVDRELVPVAKDGACLGRRWPPAGKEDDWVAVMKRVCERYIQKVLPNFATLHAALAAAWQHASPTNATISGSRAIETRPPPHVASVAEGGAGQDHLLLNVIGQESQQLRTSVSSGECEDSKSDACGSPRPEGLSQMLGGVYAASNVEGGEDTEAALLLKVRHTKSAAGSPEWC
jgi:hypothetical protein